MPWKPPEREATICKQVGTKLRQWRAEKNLDPDTLADMAGISTQSIYIAESSGRVGLPILIAICDALSYGEAIGYDIEELISFTKEERDEWPERKEKSS